MVISPYLFFEGRCDEAIAFYTEKLDAKLGIRMTYSQMPGPTSGPMPPGDKIMHASLTIGDNVVFVSDGHCRQAADFKGFQLSMQADGPADVERLFAALADGGTVIMPIAKTFFAAAFGMVSDRFGVHWMIMSN